MNIVFLADLFFEDGINGGGELSNHELINLLSKKGHTVQKMHTSSLTKENMPPTEAKLIIGRNKESYISKLFLYYL